MSDEDNVTRLPIRFKAPPEDEGRTLRVVSRWEDRSACDHTYVTGSMMKPVTYLLRDGETEVECGGCGTKLDPMFVLKRLATGETRWHEARKNYVEEMRRLDGRKRTQCDHCGKMTRISRAKPKGAENVG